MSEQFNIEIVSPDKSFFKKDDVTEVVIPAFEGEMGILKDHISIISFLKPGIIKVSSGNEETNFYAPRFYIRRCWGASYGKGDWTKVHNHGASAFGWCYYVRMPKGASPICFPEADLTIHPKEGEVIIFPGIVEHSVPPSDIEEKRIMIASNVGIK